MAKYKSQAKRHGVAVADPVLPRARRFFGRVAGALMLLLLSLALMFAWQWLQQNFVVRQVVVVGEFQADQAAEIRQAMLPYLQKSFFAVNLQQAQQAVAQLSWVDYAVLLRRWPDQIHVTVQQQQAVAYWNDSQFLNARAEIFTHPYIDPATTAELPKLYGDKLDAGIVLQQYQQLLQLPALLQPQQLRVDERGDWQLTTSSGILIQLGTQAIQPRLQRLLRVFTEHLQPRLDEIQRIDLRYSNGFAVAWQQATTTNREL